MKGGPAGMMMADGYGDNPHRLFFTEISLGKILSTSYGNIWDVNRRY
jgi:hypothetical protein